MNHELSSQKTPEIEKVPDNARKFVVHDLDRTILDGNDIVRCNFPTDWLETDENTEKKIVRKVYGDGKVQMLLIAKVTEGSKRSSEKKPLTQDEYDSLLGSSELRVEKDRYSFIFTQGDIDFKVNYDEFVGSELRILEVDAETEELRAMFDPEGFPALLEEVAAEDRSYEGYRVAGHLQQLIEVGHHK